MEGPGEEGDNVLKLAGYAKQHVIIHDDRQRSKFTDRGPWIGSLVLE